MEGLDSEVVCGAMREAVMTCERFPVPATIRKIAVLLGGDKRFKNPTGSRNLDPGQELRGNLWEDSPTLLHGGYETCPERTSGGIFAWDETGMAAEQVGWWVDKGRMRYTGPMLSKPEDDPDWAKDWERDLKPALMERFPTMAAMLGWAKVPF